MPTPPPVPSITSWVRLEPRSHDATMREGIRARVYDPLWLLARQWQVGEFEGEDSRLAGAGAMARAQRRGARACTPAWR